MGAFRSSDPNFFASQILLCPEKFVLNIYHNNSKNLAPLTIYFALQTSNLGYRACFIPAYTSKLVAFLQF